MLWQRLLFGFCFCLCRLAAAQPAPILSADYAVFFTRSGEPYVEFAYAINPFALSWVRDSTGKPACHAAVILRIAQGDSVRYQDAWRVQADTASYHAGEKMIDLRRVGLPSGNYAARLTVKNVNDPAQEAAASFSFVVPAWRPEQPGLSSLLLCASLGEAGQSASPFVKNQYLIVPQIDGVFSGAAPMTYYYFEVYNLAKTWAEPHYALRTQILDGQKNEIAGAPGRDRRKRWPGPSFIEAGAVDIQTLVTGTYFLQCAIADLSGKIFASVEKKFFVHKPELMPESVAAGPGKDPVSSELQALPEAELDKESSQVRYIANEIERVAYAQLKGAEAKRGFLSDFWQQRASAALTGMHLRRAYLQRVREADDKYSGLGRMGWETARGRVYILYGKPSEERRFANTDAARAYERWIYDNIESGVEFIFVDRTGYGDYAQVHSTKRGELEDLDWQRFLGGETQKQQ